MSTQKREIRCTGTRGTDRARVWGQIGLPQVARQVSAGAGNETARLVLTLWVALAWMATKFLLADQQLRLSVQLLFKAGRRGSPPCPAPPGKDSGWPVSPQSALPHIPFPPGIAPHPLTLPYAPAADQRRAERQDGKRDMHFLHAA